MKTNPALVLLRNLALAVLFLAQTGAFARNDVSQNGRAAPGTSELGLRTNPPGFDLGPETTAAVVEAAVAEIPEKLPAGPFKPSADFSTSFA